VAVAGALGGGLGCVLGFRWGGYVPFLAAAAAGFVGVLLGVLLGAALALVGRGSDGP
jgi:hypothetical protein